MPMPVIVAFRKQGQSRETQFSQLVAKQLMRPTDRWQTNSDLQVPGKKTDFMSLDWVKGQGECPTFADVFYVHSEQPFPSLPLCRVPCGWKSAQHIAGAQALVKDQLTHSDHSLCCGTGSLRPRSKSAHANVPCASDGTLPTGTGGSGTVDTIRRDLGRLKGPKLSCCGGEPGWGQPPDIVGPPCK